MSGTVAKYHVLFYGSPEGYQNNRAQVSLLDAHNNSLAFVRFKDPGMTLESDYLPADGIIRMHLPSSMFASVIDLLRNEKPIYVYFGPNQGFLGTSSFEPVGEAE